MNAFTHTVGHLRWLSWAYRPNKVRPESRWRDANSGWKPYQYVGTNSQYRFVHI